MNMPKYLELYFWDVSFEDLDHDKHQVFIIGRILNEGDHRAVAWLFKVYNDEAIRIAIKTSRNLSIKTARCWQNYFDLKEEELCSIGQH